MKGVTGVIILRNYFFKASRCVQEISFQFFLYHYTCIHTYLYMHLYIHFTHINEYSGCRNYILGI